MLRLPWLTSLFFLAWLAAVPGVNGHSEVHGQETRETSARKTSGLNASDWLPADTLAIGRISDVTSFREQWQNSSFGAQLNDPAFADFFDGVIERFSGIDDGLGIGIVDLIQRVDGVLSLAAVPDEETGVSVVAIAEFPDSDAATAFVEQLEQQLQSEDAKPTTLESGKTTLKSWQRDRGRTFSNLNYFIRDDALIFSDRLQTLAETARRGTDEGTARLSGNGNFQHVMERVVADRNPGGANWYADPAGIVKTAIRSGMGTTAATTQTVGADRVAGMIDALGLGQVRGLGGSFWLGQGGVDSVSNTYGYVDTPVEGVLQALKLPARPQRPPEWVKDDVSIYAQMNWGADQLVDAIEQAIDQRQGEGSFEEIVGSTRVGQSDLTYRELADRLVGPLHIASEIPQGAQELTRQRAVFALGVEDAKRFQQLAKDVAERAGANVSTVNGTEVYQYAMNVPLPGAQLPALEVAITVTDDAIMFSPNPDYLRETLGSRASMRPLAESPEYQQVATQFPEQTSMITFQRQDSRLEGLYEQLRSGLLEAGALPGLTGQLFNFDFSKLPPFPEMSRYLQTTGSFITPEEDGFRIVSFALPPREQ